MNRIVFLLFIGMFACHPVEAQKSTTTTDVAWFAPHRLGDAGWTKLQAVLDTNHISYTTTEFAATYLFVPPEQRDLTKKLIKELIDKDKLLIHLSDEGGPMGVR